jgi:hypothetical protein
MSVRKADDFIADIERQFDWYLAKAGCRDRRSWARLARLYESGLKCPE